jgi:hypothetical protein
MPAGFEMRGQRGTGERARISVDKGVFANDDGELQHIQTPDYELAQPGGE